MPLDGFATVSACNEGARDTVEQHLRDGADPNQVWDATGDTGMHGAVGGGHVEILQLLVHARGDVNRRNHGGVTPLMKAAMFGKLDCTRMLLGAGADPSLVGGGKQRTAEEMAKAEHHKEIVAAIRQHTAGTRGRSSGGFFSCCGKPQGSEPRNSSVRNTTTHPMRLGGGASGTAEATLPHREAGLEAPTAGAGLQMESAPPAAVVTPALGSGTFGLNRAMEAPAAGAGLLAPSAPPAALVTPAVGHYHER